MPTDNLQHPRQQSSRVSHTSSSLTSSCEVTPDWLSTALKACFVWTGQCLAGGFNPLYPTGTVRQRHLYKPFLRIKPVVTFFFSRIQFHEQTKAGGAQLITWNSSSQSLYWSLYWSSIQQLLAVQTRGLCWNSLYSYRKFKADLSLLLEIFPSKAPMSLRVAVDQKVFTKDTLYIIWEPRISRFCAYLFSSSWSISQDK